MQIFAEKCVFHKKSTFSVSGISFPAPSLKSLRNQCLFRCFGLHFLPFCTFPLKNDFFAPKRFLAQKCIFLRKGAYFFLFSLQNAEERAGPFTPIKHYVFYRYFELFSAKRRKCAEFCVFARNFRFFAHFSAFSLQMEKRKKAFLSKKYLSQNVYI